MVIVPDESQVERQLPHMLPWELHHASTTSAKTEAVTSMKGGNGLQMASCRLLRPAARSPCLGPGQGQQAAAEHHHRLVDCTDLIMSCCLLQLLACKAKCNEGNYQQSAAVTVWPVQPSPAQPSPAQPSPAAQDVEQHTKSRLLVCRADCGSFIAETDGTA
jgi:hypothetical protein